MRLQATRPSVLEREFRLHVEKWRDDTLISSSIAEMVTHPSYQRIIDLGSAVIPLLLLELQDRPTYWFAALQALADDGPRGPVETFDEARNAWLSWGQSVTSGGANRRASQ
jgi:hypothetical protein